MKNLLLISITSLSASLLIACGGSGSGGSSNNSSSSSIATQGAIVGTVSGLPDANQVGISINNGTPIMLNSNGLATLAQTWETADVYHVQVTEQPDDAYCVVARGIGKPTTASVDDIRINCATGVAADSAQLFDTDKLHRMRLTVSADEWNAFVFSLHRTANQTDIYRAGTLEYFDDAENLLATVPNVGFRMRGNTSRTDPETRTNNEPLNPTRFHINLKFDETFEDDESVYACIDAEGNPARVDSDQCRNRIATNIPPVVENDGRTFMGVESVALKMNKDDPTHIREALAHTLLQDNGAAAGRATHVVLELVITPTETTTELYNHSLPHTHVMGIYTLTEPVDKILVKNRYGKNGYLFKVGVSNLMQGDDPDCLDYNPAEHGFENDDYCDMSVEVIDPASRADWLGADNILNVDYVNNPPQKQFEPHKPSLDLKTKKDDIAIARTELNALIAVINSNPTIEELAAVFDIDSFIRAQAVDIVIGASDHYVRIANNYYLYQHPDTKKWYYLTYDYDFTFRNNHPKQWTYRWDQNASIPVFDNIIASTIFTASNGNRWADRDLGYEPELYNIIFSDANNRQALLNQVSELRSRWLDWNNGMKPLVDVWLDKIEAETARTTATSQFEDTVFNRNAATGNSYNMAFEDSSPSSNDTIKNYVQGRNTTLANEAP